MKTAEPSLDEASACSRLSRFSFAVFFRCCHCPGVGTRHRESKLAGRGMAVGGGLGCRCVVDGGVVGCPCEVQPTTIIPMRTKAKPTVTSPPGRFRECRIFRDVCCLNY